MHVGEENVTVPVPDWVHVTVSPVIVTVAPLTVAVHVEVPPTANDVDVQETAIDVVV